MLSEGLGVVEVLPHTVAGVGVEGDRPAADNVQPRGLDLEHRHVARALGIGVSVGIEAAFRVQTRLAEQGQRGAKQLASLRTRLGALFFAVGAATSRG